MGLSPFQIHLELSGRVPPTHGAILRVHATNVDNLPESLLVSVGAIYGLKKGIYMETIDVLLASQSKAFL